MSAGESDTMRAFGVFFSAKPEIERHLVLRADTRSADMLNAMARYAALQVSRLLFTGVDEALNVVSMADTLARSGVPATFAGTGQNIPDDLEEVSASKLAKAVWSAAGMSTGPGLARSAAA
jgi:flagellar biosynthesis GTPase FlhF